MSDPKYSHIGTPEDRCVEECAELILAIQKARRFGWHNKYVVHRGRKISNFEHVQIEILDVVDAIQNLQKLMEGLTQ